MLAPEPLEAVREFVERGGGVLLVIGAVAIVLSYAFEWVQKRRR